MNNNNLLTDRLSYRSEHMAPTQLHLFSYNATDIDEQDYKELLAATSTKVATAIAAVKEQPEQAEEDTIVIDKITEVIKDLQEGKPVESDGGQALTRIFEDEFDTVFA